MLVFFVTTIPKNASQGIAKLGFTGSTATGTSILKAAADSLIPTTLELGGKSPNIFFSSVCAEDDAFLDKAVEGAVLFALNQVSFAPDQVRTPQHELMKARTQQFCHVEA